MRRATTENRAILGTEIEQPVRNSLIWRQTNGFQAGRLVLSGDLVA